jgi:hypothetical protein
MTGCHVYLALLWLIAVLVQGNDVVSRHHFVDLSNEEINHRLWQINSTFASIMSAQDMLGIDQAAYVSY